MSTSAIQHTPGLSVYQQIEGARKITPEDVLALRREVWPDGTISREEAESLLALDETLHEQCGEWEDFLNEAVIVHLIDRSDPRGFINDADAVWLHTKITNDGAVKGSTELEILVTLLEKAQDVPHQLEMLALGAVRDAVLTGNQEIVDDKELQAGVIGDPEVAFLRRILYAKAGARSEGIARDEAELLFELNDATANASNCAAWTTLFVNAISNALLVECGYEPPQRERMKEIDSWLNEPSRGIAGFFGAIAGTSSGERDLHGAQEYYAARNLTSEELREKAQAVDLKEARWLVERLKRDGELTPNEKALLTFLKEGGFNLHHSLGDVLAKV